MNKEMLAKCQYHIVRLRPIAQRFQGPIELEQYDDDWMIMRADPARNRVELHNMRTSAQCPILGFDHIHSYLSDPMRDVGDRKHGFLNLNVLLFLTERGPVIEPLRPY